MNRILVLGSPGSGKSTLSRRLNNILNYNILHLDKVFHIDNFNSVSKTEFIKQITQFIKKYKNFIIDGHYFSTIEFRLKFVDTVILLDFDTEICLNNVIKRTKVNLPRPDMATGFDNSKMDKGFIDYVKTFKEKIIPKTINLLKKHNNIKLTILSNYLEVDEYINEVKIKNINNTLN